MKTTTKEQVKEVRLNPNTQFFLDLIDEKTQMNVNGNLIPKGYYNLIISIRDCGIYAVGMKPHRHWKISDVKRYFGVKGNAQQIYNELKEIKKAITI